MNHDPILFGLSCFHGQAIGDVQINMDITILINGWLVSGVVTSKEDYLNSHPILASIDGAIQHSLNANELPANTVLDNESEFLHLRGVKFFNGNHAPIPNNNGIFLRCRWSAIAGFIIGTLQAN